MYLLLFYLYKKEVKKWFKHTVFIVAFFEYWHKPIFLQLEDNQLIMAVKAVGNTLACEIKNAHGKTKIFDAMNLIPFLLF